MSRFLIGVREESDPGVGLWWCADEVIAKSVVADFNRKFGVTVEYTEYPDATLFLDFGGSILQSWNPIEINCGVAFKFWAHQLYNVIHALNTGLREDLPYVKLSADIGIILSRS